MDRRSHNGCWTCRVRRKKCDESSPSCTKCQSLGLPCHGFGPRPSWMDSGPRQRAKSLEFKEIIKRRPRQQRHNRNDSESQVESLQEEMILTCCASQPADATSRTFSTEELLTPAPTVTLPSPVSAEMASSSHEMPWDTFPGVFDTVFEMSPNNATNTFDMAALNHTSSPVANFDVMETDPSASMETSAYLQPSGDNAMVELNHMKDPHRPGNPLPLPASSCQNWEFPEEVWSHHQCPSTERSANPQDMILLNVNHPADLSSISSRHWQNGYLQDLKTWELDAIVYYLDVVIHRQFPFLDATAAKTISGELAQLASKSRCLLASTLGQGLLIQSKELQGIGIQRQRDISQQAVRLRKVAVEELRLMLQQLVSAKERVNASESSIQVEAHVCLVFASLAKEARGGITWADICQLWGHLEPISLNRLDGGGHLLACFFQTVLACLDLFCCVSTAALPSFALKFSNELHRTESQLCVDKVLGCDQRILKYIMSVAELQHWKESHVTNGTMSMVELMKRGIVIERELQQFRQLAAESQVEHQGSNPLLRQQSAVNDVFVCAVAVYLYGTLCGLGSKAPELNQSIEDTIAAIKAVPNASIILGLAWPITIAALASQDSHRPFFRSLERGIMEQFGKCQVCDGLTAAFCFWDRRISAGAAVDKFNYSWKEALSQEGGAIWFSPWDLQFNSES